MSQSHLANAPAVLARWGAARLFDPKFNARSAAENIAHGERAALWNTLYGFDWRGVTTNNYGFAPADGDGPERFQHQMYAELLKLLSAGGRMKPHTDLLEVSCGRGGGLAHLVRTWPGSVTATGLDLAANAIRSCERSHASLADLKFVRGSALDLPFPDAAFDAIVNVEASNDYGDFPGFLREVHRVLRPDGVFLHADTRSPAESNAIEQAMRDAGFTLAPRDITDNVIAACREDTPRRLKLIRDGTPWIVRMLFGKGLESYAGVEGSPRYERFVTGVRRYVMTYAVKAGSEPAEDQASSVPEPAGA